MTMSKLSQEKQINIYLWSVWNVDFRNQAIKEFFIWHLDNRNKKGHPHLTNDFDSACRFEGKNFDPHAFGVWILNYLTFRVQN